MPKATVRRQYRMIRLEKGDYLLPSNDAQILWRIAQYHEDDGTKLWGLWRWDGGMPTIDQIAAALDEGMWTDRWEYWDGGYRKRSEVIAYLAKCREGNA
jgi:hypothetical protein